MGKLIDLTGQRFGRLTVEGRAGTYISPYGDTRFVTWRCKCDCGKDTVAIGNNLKRGVTRSCGCLRRERCSKAMREYHARRLANV